MNRNKVFLNYSLQKAEEFSVQPENSANLLEIRLSMLIWKSGLIINFDKNELLSLTCQSEPC